MTKRELLAELINDTDSSMDEEVRFAGNVFETAEVETDDLTVIMINSSENDEATLVLG